MTLLRPPAFVREVNQVVDVSRRHGPFDPRWLFAAKEGAGALATAPPLRSEEALEALHWEAFSRRYFPERTRHDMQALTAYATYTRGREWRTTPARLCVVPTDHVPTRVEFEWHEAGTRRLLAAMAANRT